MDKETARIIISKEVRGRYKKISMFGEGGIGRLFINDEKEGEGQIPTTMKFRYSADIAGRDSASPVNEEYKAGAATSN